MTDHNTASIAHEIVTKFKTEVTDQIDCFSEMHDYVDANELLLEHATFEELSANDFNLANSIITEINNLLRP